MHYLLLTIYLASPISGGVSVTAIEFNNKAQCQLTAKYLSKTFDKNQFVCVEKGQEKIR